MLIKKRTLEEIPFDEFYKMSEEELIIHLEKLKVHCNWLLPQIIAHYGNFTPVATEGKYDPLATLKTNVGTDPFELGLWKVCTKVDRSAIITKQVEFPDYSALVPLILAGFKKYQDIPYKSWSTEGLEYLVGNRLYKLMTYEPTPLTKEQTLELRQQGLTIKSGKQAGSTRNPKSVWKLSGLKGTPWEKAPDLYTCVAAQTWVAHPSLRTQYMVLDCNDWDKMPEVLVTTDILETQPRYTTTSKEDSFNDIPWL